MFSVGKKYRLFAAGADEARTADVEFGRNTLRGPGYADVDASIFKNMFTGERVSAQFQAEAFNTLTG